MLNLRGTRYMRFHFDQRLLASHLRRFFSDVKGATAIEFAVVIGPFLFLLFGIMSVGFYFFVVFSLEHAVESASRVIRTGQEQTVWTTGSSTKDAQFRDLVCAKLPPFMTCTGSTNKIRIIVQTFTGYGSITEPTCLTSTGTLMPTTSQSYNTGSANSIVLVTVCYEWELSKSFASIPYWISPRPGRMTNNSTLIKASTAFTNEPY